MNGTAFHIKDLTVVVISMLHDAPADCGAGHGRGYPASAAGAVAVTRGAKAYGKAA